MLRWPAGASPGFGSAQSVLVSCVVFSAVNAHVSFPGVFPPALPPNMIVRADCVSNAIPISAFGGGEGSGPIRLQVLLLLSYSHVSYGPVSSPMPPYSPKRAAEDSYA